LAIFKIHFLSKSKLGNINSITSHRTRLPRKAKDDSTKRTKAVFDLEANIRDYSKEPGLLIYRYFIFYLSQTLKKCY